MTVTGPSAPFQSISSTGTALSFSSNLVEIGFPFGEFNIGSDSSINEIQILTVAYNGDVFFDSHSPMEQPRELCPAGATTADPLYQAHVAVFNCIQFTGGIVYTLSKSLSIIISFENMVFGTSTFNAQVEIYQNGNIELRYGSGGSLGSNTCSIGIADSTRSTCYTINHGSCSTSGLCTSFPANSGFLFGTRFESC